MASYTFTYDPERKNIPSDRVCFICEGEKPDMVALRHADEKHPEMTAYGHDKCIADFMANKLVIRNSQAPGRPGAATAV